MKTNRAFLLSAGTLAALGLTGLGTAAHATTSVTINSGDGTTTSVFTPSQAYLNTLGAAVDSSYGQVSAGGLSPAPSGPTSAVPLPFLASNGSDVLQGSNSDIYTATEIDPSNTFYENGDAFPYPSPSGSLGMPAGTNWVTTNVSAGTNGAAQTLAFAGENTYYTFVQTIDPAGVSVADISGDFSSDNGLVAIDLYDANGNLIGQDDPATTNPGYSYINGSGGANGSGGPNGTSYFENAFNFANLGPAVTPAYLTFTIYNQNGPASLAYTANVGSPAPEPSGVGMLALIGLGLGGLVLRSRRATASA